ASRLPWRRIVIAAPGAASETTTTGFSGSKISAAAGSPATAARCTCVAGKELTSVAEGGCALAAFGTGPASFAGVADSCGAGLESFGGGRTSLGAGAMLDATLFVAPLFGAPPLACCGPDPGGPVFASCGLADGAAPSAGAVGSLATRGAVAWLPCTALPNASTPIAYHSEPCA